MTIIVVNSSAEMLLFSGQQKPSNPQPAWVCDVSGRASSAHKMAPTKNCGCPPLFFGNSPTFPRVRSLHVRTESREFEQSKSAPHEPKDWLNASEHCLSTLPSSGKALPSTPREVRGPRWAKRPNDGRRAAAQTTHSTKTVRGETGKVGDLQFDHGTQDNPARPVVLAVATLIFLDLLARA